MFKLSKCSTCLRCATHHTGILKSINGRYPGVPVCRCAGVPVCLRPSAQYIKKNVGCRALSGVVGCRALSNIKQHTHLRDSHCRRRYWTIKGKKKIVGKQIVE